MGEAILAVVTNDTSKFQTLALMMMSVKLEGTLVALTVFVLTLFFVTDQPVLHANAKMGSKAVILLELSSVQILTSVLMIIIASNAVLADVVKTLTEVSSATAPRVTN